MTAWYVLNSSLALLRLAFVLFLIRVCFLYLTFVSLLCFFFFFFANLYLVWRNWWITYLLPQSVRGTQQWAFLLSRISCSWLRCGRCVASWAELAPAGTAEVTQLCLPCFCSLPGASRVAQKCSFLAKGENTKEQAEIHKVSWGLGS